MNQNINMTRAEIAPKRINEREGISVTIDRCAETYQKLDGLVSILEEKLNFILLPSDKQLAGEVNVLSNSSPLSQHIQQISAMAEVLGERVQWLTSRVDQ